MNQTRKAIFLEPMEADKRIFGIRPRSIAPKARLNAIFKVQRCHENYGKSSMTRFQSLQAANKKKEEKGGQAKLGHINVCIIILVVLTKDIFRTDLSGRAVAEIANKAYTHAW